MVFNEHVKIREEKFGMVIFETLKEKIFVTNQTGKEILNLVNAGCPLEEIINLLTDSYGLKTIDIKEDVVSFLGQLRENGIIKS